MDIVSEALIYGYVHRHSNGSIQDLPKLSETLMSVEGIFDVFRNPPIIKRVFRRQYTNEQISK